MLSVSHFRDRVNSLLPTTSPIAFPTAWPTFKADTVSTAAPTPSTQHSYTLQTAKKTPCRTGREYVDFRASVYEYKSKATNISQKKREELQSVAHVLRGYLLDEHATFAPSDYVGLKARGPLRDVRDRVTFASHVLENCILEHMRKLPLNHTAVASTKTPADALAAFIDTRGSVTIANFVRALLSDYETRVTVYKGRMQNASYGAAATAGGCTFGLVGAVAGLAAFRVTRLPGLLIAKAAPYTGYLGHPTIDVPPPK